MSTFSSAASAGCQSRGPPPRLSPLNLSPECQAFLETVALQQGQRREARSPVFLFFFVFFLATGHSEKKVGIAVFRDSLRHAPLEQQRPSTPTCERAESVPGIRCPLRGLPGHGCEPRCERERALLLLTLL